MKYRQRKLYEMKESNVDWIGVIPKEWRLGKIQNYFNVRNEKVDAQEFKALSVTKSGVVPQLKNVAKTDNEENRKKVLKGDFVINSRADRRGSCGLSSYTGSVSLIYHVLEPQKDINLLYTHYLFRSHYFSEEFYRWGTGIVDDLWSTNIEKMKKILIPINREQKKIGKFLSIKTSEVNSLIKKKEELIKKLEEAKKSLISEVITGKKRVYKDDNGEYKIENRPHKVMKDSYVERLGMIPNDWELKALKFLISTNPEKKELRINQEEKCTFVPMKNIRTGKLILSDEKKIKSVYTGYTYFKEGDIILAKVTPCFENKNIAIAEGLKNGVGFGSSELYVFRSSKKINNLFLYYLLQEEAFISLGTFEMTGAGGLKRVPINFIKNYKVAIPDYTTQVKIGKYIKQKESELNFIIKETRIQIKKMKEAKKSLIFEAVTGKIEVLD